MIEWYDQLFIKLKLVSRHKKVQISALQTFADVVVGVPDALPSGQCINGCTAKDNADVTDHCKQMVASCKSIQNRF